MISVEKLPLQYMTLNVSVAKKRKTGNTNTASRSWITWVLTLAQLRTSQSLKDYCHL